MEFVGVFGLAFTGLAMCCTKGDSLLSSAIWPFYLRAVAQVGARLIRNTLSSETLTCRSGHRPVPTLALTMTHRTTVLISDPDIAQLGRLSEILDDKFSVQTLDDVSRTAQRVSVEHPSVLLMPADDATFSTCRQVARDHSTTKVILYGGADDGLMEASFANGAFDFLQTPIHPELLKNKVRVLSRLRTDGEIAEIVGRANADMLAEKERLELDRNTMREMLTHSLKHMHARWTQRELRSVKRLMDEYDKRAIDYQSSIVQRGDSLSDMRCYPRSDYRVQVALFLPRPVLSGESLIRVWCRNVSASGLSFFYNREIRDHEVIAFLEPKNRKPLCCYGTIVRCEKASHDFWEYGVRFANRSTLTSASNRPQLANA